MSGIVVVPIGAGRLPQSAHWRPGHRPLPLAAHRCITHVHAARAHAPSLGLGRRRAHAPQAW